MIFGSSWEAGDRIGPLMTECEPIRFKIDSITSFDIRGLYEKDRQ